MYQILQNISMQLIMLCKISSIEVGKIYTFITEKIADLYGEI